MICKNKCHDHDFGRLLEDRMLLGDGDGGSLLLSERDAAVACFSEIAVFRDAMFGAVSVGLSIMARFRILRVMRAGREVWKRY